MTIIKNSVSKRTLLRRQGIKKIFALSGLAMCSLFHMSDLAAAKTIDWFGFMSAGFGRTDSPQNYAEVSDRGTFIADTRLGLNARTKLNDEWSVVAQILGRGKQENFDLVLDWGQINFRPSEFFHLIVGKQQSRFWLTSDYIDVGILYPWVRPIEEVHFMNPSKSFTGITTIYNINLSSSWRLGIDLYYGNSTVTFGNLEGAIDNLFGSVVSVSTEGFKARFSYSQAQVDLDRLVATNLLAAALESTLAAYGTFQLDTFIDLNLGLAQFLSGGIEIDWNNIAFWGEVAYEVTRGAGFQKGLSAYGTLGYYFADRKLLPHVTLARQAIIESTLAAGSQTSVIAGVNYWFSHSIKFKAEYQHLFITGADPTLGSALLNGANVPENVNIVSASLDVSF